MKNPQSATRHLILSCALGCLTACVTPADRTVNSSDNDTAVASSDTAQPPVVMKETAVAGTTETGEKIYCRKTPKPGSRVMKTTCMTEEQRRKQQEFAEKILKGASRRTLNSRTAR